MPDKDLGKVFNDGEIIFRQGDVADCLYIILSGKVALCREKDGTEVPLAELGKGDLFGEGGFFMDPKRTECARALGEARVITADYKFVLKKFRDDPSFAFHIIETMAQHARERTEELEKTVEDQHLHQEKLAAQNRNCGKTGRSWRSPGTGTRTCTISRRSATSTSTEPVSSWAST